MNITREEPATRQVVLSIQLDPPDIEPYLDRVYRRLVNRVQIPGFRKGKAPRSILENHMGREAMLREGLDIILPESIDRAISEEKLEPFGDPDMELVELDPMSVKAVVPLEPVVDLGNYGELRLEAEPVEVTQQQVDEAIAQLRRGSGVWEPRQGGVRFDDLVTLDVDGIVEGRRIAHDRGVDYIPRQDNPLPFPGFSIYLEGMSQGETNEFALPIPDNYPDSSIAGKECHFNVKVLQVKEMRLPELDDEFAKGVGDGYESLEALRATVQERLQDEAEREARHAFQERSLEELIKGAQVEFAPLTEERELDRLMEDRARAMEQHRVPMDAYLRESNKTEDEIKEELRPEAARRLIRFLVLRKLGSNEGIEVPPEEVDAEIDQMANLSSSKSEETRQTLSSESARSALTSAIFSRKVLERLADILQGATPAVKSEETATEDDSSPEESEGGPGDS